jgi:type II secretory pathway pseudopilin PulG
MTLLELLLALAGTALIGAAIVGMLTAVTYGAQREKQLQAIVAQRQAVVHRIDAAVRSAKEVRDVAADTIVLWAADTNGDGKASTDELTVIRHNAEDNTLTAYYGQADQSTLLSDLVIVGSLIDTLADMLTGPEFTAERWAEHCTDWSVSLDADNPTDAHLVSHRLTLERGEMQEIAISAAHLREKATPQ